MCGRGRSVPAFFLSGKDLPLQRVFDIKVIQMKTMKLGDFEIISLFENRFLIDGGAMFGVVPKVLWSKFVPADENNMITLNIHPLLIKTGKNNVLVDAGIGDVLDDKMKKIYGVEGPSQLTASLKEAGLAPEDIDTVIFTHLHADHSLGGLKFNDKGEVVKIFPNAKFFAQKFEIEDALNPNERTVATYLVELLRHYGEIQAVDGDGKIVDGVAVVLSGGHTRGHQVVFIDGGKETMLYPGDIIPTVVHLRPPYIGAVDSFPLDTLTQKGAIIKECVEKDRYLAYDHDFEIRIGKLVREDNDIIKVVPVV